MKRWLSVLILPGLLGLFLFTGIPGVEAEVKVTSKGNYNKPGSSYHTTAIREHVHEYEQIDIPSTVEKYEKYDYGAFLDLVLYETKDKKVQVISKNTWEVNRDQYTSLLGAKVNVWSIFKK